MKRLLLSLVVLTCLASIAQAKGPYRYRPYFYSGNSNYARGQSMLDYDLLSHGGYGPGGVDYYLLRAPSAYGYTATHTRMVLRAAMAAIREMVISAAMAAMAGAAAIEVTNGTGPRVDAGHHGLVLEWRLRRLRSWSRRRRPTLAATELAASAPAFDAPGSGGVAAVGVPCNFVGVGFGACRTFGGIVARIITITSDSVDGMAIALAGSPRGELPLSE